jgi:hypothetical protein
MARQLSIVKLKGTIGGINFYRSMDGFMAREKGGVDASRIATDPSFQRTRENGTEFGAACSAGKVLRVALRALLQNVSDTRMVSRLAQSMTQVIKADKTSVRGQRNVIDGEAELLKDFDFNINGLLSMCLFAPFTSTIDRAAGTLKVSIAPFNPKVLITAPDGATHFKIVAAGTEVDFENETNVTDSKESDMLPLDATITAALELSTSVTPASKHPLFIALGIEFYQDVNGEKYSLKNGAFNALKLVKVDGGV